MKGVQLCNTDQSGPALMEDGQVLKGKEGLEKPRHFHPVFFREHCLKTTDVTE